ncbi:DUF4125 family protein [Aromatoleum toluclasticum]|uniref:DUF4125 family protein n=1 Tax=Aromatoleum toluclasticum TaxID=92003 RepID=UPI00037F99B7|nr:DUF4125 family protein [Aromatoleum toluclasticum]MCC4116659.1 DUF4125 family protein [Aromatoleum toluclasticum]
MSASILDRILEAEWQMFVRVRSARHAPCQSAPDNFKTIRSSLFETWTLPMLASYLADLEQAEAAGRNLLAEKYARMDNLIPPLSNSPLIDVIVTVESNWQEELERRYPALYRRCCRSTDETGDGRNFGIYLGCELETYSDQTLALYFENIEDAVADNRNLAVEALHRLVCKNGYRDPDHAESVLKHGETA